jgi:type I restriction enzyme M protein
MNKPMASNITAQAQRDSASLSALTKSVETLSDKVANHLKAMGLEWTL